jgi:membrane protease YdiL (CAAX protease family)
MTIKSDQEVQSTMKSRLTLPAHSSQLAIVTAFTILLVSQLPAIFWKEITGTPATWLLPVDLGLLAILLALTYIWQIIRPLRSFFAILIVLYVAEWTAGLVGDTPLWKSWFNSSAFTTTMVAAQLLRVAVALIMVTVLWGIKRNFNAFFLVKGQLNAPAMPIPLIGVQRPTDWSRLGPSAALCISLGTLAFLVIAGMPSSDTLTKVLPVVPMILLLAAMNAFAEEMSYRAALLATLHNVIGRPQALILTALFFGIGHFYGVPYGIVGVALASALGWFLGKAMLETKGFVWSWAIHFLQDVLIFSFMAMGAITAGGK